MFVFDNSEDLDIATYEYRLYTEDQVDPDPVNAGYFILNGNVSINSGTITPYRQGFNLANVFTVSVENSTTTSTTSTTSPVYYYGAIRAIDTSANVGPWTLITITDDKTPLIDQQFIGSLTAAKITTGTIGAAEITLNGSNSIIKSSGYLQGQLGWKITGNGDAEFNELTVRTALDIGGSDTSSFHVDIDGNLWLGASTYATAPFKVSNIGNVDVGSTGVGDTSSFHIDKDGNIWSGAGTFNTATNPFSVTAAGALRASSVTITNPVVTTPAITGGSISGTSLDIGTGTTSFHVDTSGNLWSGASTYATAPFKVSNTGNVDVGSTGVGDTSSFHIDNTGNIWSGAETFNTATNPFSVTAAGALRASSVTITNPVVTTPAITGGSISGTSLDIGTGTTSFHVDTSGNLWSGASTYATAPFKVSNTGNVDVGSTGVGDTSSFHIDNTGNIWSGAETFNTTTNPFAVTAAGAIKATSGRIGPVLISSSSMNSQGSSPYLNSNNNYYGLDNFGDIYIYSNPGTDVGGPHVNQYHSTALVGEYIQIKKASTSAFSDNLYEARIGDTSGTYAEVVVQNASTSSYVAMYSTGNMSVTGSINGYSFTSGRHNGANQMVHTDGNGYLQVGYINSSNGNEGNNSNPSRVWGTNGSDDYLRSYLTSALSVGSATTATTANFAYCGNNQIPAKATYNSTSLVGIMQTGSSTTARLSIGDSGNTHQELKAPTSRRYLKENIQDIDDALSILNAIRPRKFNWKIDAFNKSDPFTQESWTDEAKTINQLSFTYGFIAEEIFEDRPDLAVLSHGSPQIPRDQEGGLYDLNSWEPVMWKEIDMIPIAVKAIQELSAKVDELEARLI